jgi:hypothetical protein
MLPKQEVKKSVFVHNIRVQEPELQKYSEKKLWTALCCTRLRPKGEFSRGDRNFNIFVLRYQQGMTFSKIGKLAGITTERVRQLVKIELRALTKILNEM